MRIIDAKMVLLFFWLWRFWVYLVYFLVFCWWNNNNNNNEIKMWTRMNLWAWILTGAFRKLISNILGIFESRLHDSVQYVWFLRRKKNFLQFFETRMGDSWLDLTQFYLRHNGMTFFFIIIFVSLRFDGMSSIFNLQRNFFIKSKQGKFYFKQDFIPFLCSQVLTQIF